jgi:small ligand-binding sensory domain FIST
MAGSIVTPVSVRIGSGLSIGPDPRAAAAEAGTQARAALDTAHADVACVFCTGAHLAAPEATLEGVHEALAPPLLVGCGAGGVLAGSREIERGTAVAVWAARLGEGSAEPFHAEALETPEGPAVAGLPDLERASGALLFPDPYSFPTDAALGALARMAPGVPVLGGLSSARTADGEAALFLGDRVLGSGAVGVRLDGVELLPCVSQGAAPLGPELTVTAAEGNLIHELAGRPALEKLRDAIEALGDAERALVAGGLLLGIVIDGGKPEYRQGDFLVRGLIGADPDAGTIAVGATVEPGTVVRLHARDAGSADRDLREALGLRREAMGGAPPAGALVFTCNGRGRGMFGEPDHDAAALADELGGAPAAGFFAAGEIGPVGGDSFLHGFTATVAVFPA